MFLVKLLSLLGVALLAGGWMMGSMLIVPAQRILSASAYTAVEQANTVYGERYFPIVAVGSVILLVVLLVLNRKEKSINGWLVAISLVLIIAAVGFTGARMLPLNKEIDGWSVQSPPSDWQAKRDAWHTGHRIRTALAVPAFLLLSTALLRAKPEGVSTRVANPKTRS